MKTCVCLISAVLLCCTVAAAQMLTIDPQKSTITVHVYKTGLFSALGHDHEIQAPIESGEVNLGSKTVQLTVDARKMKVLDPDLAADKRAEVQKTMHSAEVLDSERFHEIKFQSTTVESRANGTMTVRGDLTLHGQSHPVTVDVQLANGQYTGQAKLKQTTFGIKPPSAGGGTVKSKDEVMVEFRIVTIAARK